MAIKIVSDRMLDLPKAELEELNIDTISCYINVDGKSYSDLDDIFPEDIKKHMEETGKVAKTAAKSPTLYAEFFQQFVDQGDSVVHLSVSSGISSISDHAKIAAKSFPGKVFAIDTRLLSNGIALLAKYALSLISKGETSAENLAKKIEEKISKVQCSFLIDSLECIYKGGRCGGFTFYASNFLKIKPVIYMEESGKMVVREKFRGNQEKVLEKYIKSTFEQYPNPDLSQLYIVYSTYDEKRHEEIRRLVKKYYNFENIQFNKVGCNCYVHCGENTVGLFYICK